LRHHKKTPFALLKTSLIKGQITPEWARQDSDRADLRDDPHFEALVKND